MGRESPCKAVCEEEKKRVLTDPCRGSRKRGAQLITMNHGSHEGSDSREIEMTVDADSGGGQHSQSAEIDVQRIEIILTPISLLIGIGGVILLLMLGLFLLGAQVGGEETPATQARPVIRSGGAETTGGADFAEPATIRFSELPPFDYTLRILYDIIIIHLKHCNLRWC